MSLRYFYWQQAWNRFVLACCQSGLGFISRIIARLPRLCSSSHPTLLLFFSRLTPACCISNQTWPKFFILFYFFTILGDGSYQVMFENVLKWDSTQKNIRSSNVSKKEGLRIIYAFSGFVNKIFRNSINWHPDTHLLWQELMYPRNAGNLKHLCLKFHDSNHNMHMNA